MLDKIAHYFDFQQRALNLQAYRAEVIGSNVANAETPYYKAVDFDFKSALQAQVDKQGQLGLALTDARHIANQTGGGAVVQLKYRSAVQPSLDGNTVDMDIERGAFADNALQYQSTLAFLNKKISGLSSAIQGSGNGG
ncbi:flagellar basal body rod protein FlgB [Chromobacterium violaceum]|uniref:flagellar basal body rod protein FlgB n=1 Tax=Chromobacterium violaceum TaxID=536 RepID=UPI0009DA5B07|nr:flagellar basal body rod protein FlgB [Chromobacterium violaceum]OQS45162.1 flagellar basal-body rod protein FlgB [Chromobacterium violaceum]OQS46672.1 flagellar basal-body rod protein FlgB [Chromobacterium violaceum]QRO33522.1 flagellar basal body rod protein FlgB [Chromobacterium violaceum]QRQ16674.1 flagellar basal body rod protein FlgB [Chromobacterium violaceum]